MKPRNNRERKDLFLFAKDNKLTDKQIDIILREYESGTEYESCIESVRFVAADNRAHISQERML